MAFGGCILYSFGVFLPAMTADLSVTRTALSAPYSLVGLVQGFSGPLAGISVHKFGPRKNIVIGNLICGLCLIALYFMTDVWQIYIIFVLLGFGCSIGSFNPATTIANNWFIKKKTLAISLVVSALGVGGFVFPLVITWMISTIGWRWAWVILGSFILLFSVVISGIIIRNKPEDLGQVPDGKLPDKTKADNKPAVKSNNTAKSRSITSVYQTPVDWDVRDAIKTRAFWLILIFSATNTFTVQFFTTQEVIYLQDKGFDPITAASALSLLVIVSALSKLATGWIGTKIDNQYLATASMALSGIGIFTLMQVTDVTVLYISSVLIGLAYGNNVIFYPSFVGSYFGRKNYSRIMGIMSPFVFLIAASAPIVSASIFDNTKSYFWAFIITLALITSAVICAALAKPPKPKIKEI